jgi:uncharacterized protein
MKGLSISQIFDHHNHYEMNPILHNEAHHRFEMQVNGKINFLQYIPIRDGMEITHTEVDRELEGNGYGAELAKHALDYAKEHQLRIVPSCPFVKVFLIRHPEYEKLIA